MILFNGDLRQGWPLPAYPIASAVLLPGLAYALLSRLALGFLLQRRIKLIAQPLTFKHSLATNTHFL